MQTMGDKSIVQNFPSSQDILSEEFLSKYKGKQPKWGFNGLGYIVYKRTYSRIKENGVSEEWNDTVERCIRGAQKIGACYTKEEAERLYDHIFNLRCNFAGRMLWQLGTKTVDKLGLPSLVNCWYVNINEPESFCFLFEHSMLGGGVGYSVKREHVHELPKVKDGVIIEHKNTKDADFIVPDSREGWVELLRNLLDSFFSTGKSFSYSTILIRGYGEKINTFGGVASGPQILIDGITNICNIFNKRCGKKLRSIDALDICNIIGSIVVSGNVRRSAQIAIGDADDKLFLGAKRWDLGNIPNWRAMSNNTIEADTIDYFSVDFWNGYIGKGEAYGLFNKTLCENFGRLIDGPMKNCKIYPKNRDKIDGLNPCQPSFAPIITRDGLKKFEDINAGDEIWSESGWTKILKKWSNGIKKVYKYRTTAGYFIGTENHKILSSSKKIEVNLADGIDVLSGPTIDDHINHDPFIIMDGLVVGDGSYHKGSNNLVGLHIGKNDSDYFESEISDLILKYRPGISNTFFEIQTSISYKELDKMYERKIPDRFVFSDKNTTCSFLRGLYSANGSVCRDRITFKTASPYIRDSLQIMLSSVGISSYFTTNKEKKNKFSNGIYICKESYDINITSDRDKFAKLIGFIQSYKNDKIVTRVLYKRKNEYPIIEKKYLGEFEVFDITVNNDKHTYWSGCHNVSNCSEANLEHGEPCDLAELYLSNINDEKELFDCAYLLYKTQKAVLTLPSISKWTNDVVKRNMRIGLGVTGVCENVDKIKWLDGCYFKLREFDKKWSRYNNWPESIKLTVVKPSGTLSILAGCTPGCHPSYDKYFIRRIRMASNDSLVGYCRNAGYKIEYQIGFDGKEQHETVVIEFPCRSSDTAILAKDMSAVKQLEIMKNLQTFWADQSVSVTIYYRKEELDSIKSWLDNNYNDSVKTVSFLLHQDHGFIQAPYESITEEKYNELIFKIKPIINIDDVNSSPIESIECSGGVCPVR